MRTLATPDMPMREAAALDRSMILPFTNGPRSLIVTVTERPLLKFSTKTLVPNGNERCAAAFFLLSHGSVKLALVLAVMRGFAWAYPAFLGALGLLIGYQTYQLWHDFSVGLTALTIFDVLVFVLTWHEYWLVRISKRDA